MSGSSRSLQRAFTCVFEAWDPALDWKSDPSPQIKALYGTIYKYMERHNTISTISGTANDDLRAAHEEYVKKSGEGSREVFFLELLARLLPVLNEEEVSLWLHTYLRPAIDSAGFDLAFVDQARAFIHAITLEVFPSDDAVLLLRRHAIASMVMEHIVQIYIGGSPSAYVMIGMSVLDIEKDTQIHVERVRFIEKNACSLLREWGLKNPRPFFTLLHKYYLSPQKRFKVLDLGSRVVSCNVSQIQQMLDTPFFLDLIKSLLLDCSESILGSCLSILLMTIGKVCHKISAYLPELFAIYTRILLWKEHGTQLSTNDVHGVSWEFAESDQNNSIMQTQIYTDGQFNMLYFTTLMYGLFPLNLMAFCKSPHDFFLRNSPKSLGPDTATVREAISQNDDLQKTLAAKSNVTLLRLMLHPNILSNVTLKEELQNPINWILKKNEGADVGEEEVLIECFSLNPDIFFSIPENIVLPDKLLRKIQSVNGLANDVLDLRFRHTAALNEGSRPTSHRGSFQLSNENPLDSKLPSLWLNMDRRVSIIPTRLVLENNGPVQLTNPSLPKQEIGEIRFKSVDFGGSGTSINSDSTIRDDKSFEAKKKDHLSDLYTVHEKLFTSSAAVTANQTTVNADTAHTTAGNFQGSTSTASNILNKQLQTEGKVEIQESDISDSRQQSAGSALDFYQRELLLMKNELEFSSYMKHLNKINYIKLKLKFNRMIKDQSVHTVAKLDKGQSPELNTLMQSLKQLQESSKETLAIKNAENEQLLSKIQALQEEITQLSTTSERAKSALNETESIVQRLKAEVKTKEDDIREVQYKIGVLEQKAIESSLLKQKRQQEREPASQLYLNEEEKAIANYQVQLGLLQAENKNLEYSLEKATAELNLQKKSVDFQITEKTSELKDAFRLKEEQYERKIKELNTLKVKYELVLEEQSSKIAHLSKVKPIQIPGINTQALPIPTTPMGPRTFSTTPQMFPGDINGESFSRNGHVSQKFTGYDYSPRKDSTPSLESVSLSATTPGLHVGDVYHKFGKIHEPPRANSSSSIPIIRGRGGYQKRSKKIM